MCGGNEAHRFQMKDNKVVVSGLVKMLGRELGYVHTLCCQVEGDKR